VIIRRILRAVVAKLKLAPSLKLLVLRMVSMTIADIPITIGEKGNNLPAYSPRARAEIAIGAANPMVMEMNPERNPNEGW
jgi:hypothetical protein